MSIIALKCPNCGGNLEFEDSREFGFCQFCGTKVMIREEINKTVNNTVNNFNSTTIINSSNDEQNRKKISAAQKALSEKRFDMAEKIANEILTQDSTIAEAYLVLLGCVALKDFIDYGYISKSSEEAVRTNYENYHVYSTDSRSLKEVLNDLGISYSAQSVTESLRGQSLSDVEDGIRLISSIMVKTGIKVKEKELLKKILGTYLECPGVLVGVSGDLFEYEVPNFCDFVYSRNGKTTSFFEEYSELRQIYSAYQDYRKKMGVDVILSKETLEEYLQTLGKSSGTHSVGMRLFGKKNQNNSVDYRKHEQILMKILETSGNSKHYIEALKEILDDVSKTDVSPMYLD